MEYPIMLRSFLSDSIPAEMNILQLKLLLEKIQVKIGVRMGGFLLF
jgi:hypothetical protein